MSDLFNHLKSKLTAIPKNQQIFDTNAKVVTNTIKGIHLKKDDVENIKSIYRDFIPDENIAFIWSNTAEFAYDSDNVLVGVTNYRIFSLEKGHPISVLRSLVKSYEHVKKGSGRWDELICTMKDDSVQTIQIYHNVACAYFFKQLTDPESK